MKLILSQSADKRTIIEAMKLDTRYGGLNWVFSDVAPPKSWTGPIILDDEGNFMQVVAAGPRDEPDHGYSNALDGLLKKLAGDPRITGYYGVPPTHNDNDPSYVRPQQARAFAMLDLVTHSKAAYPALYAPAHGDLGYFVEHALYVALMMHSVVIGFIHPRTRNDELLSDADLAGLVKNIQLYRHPRNGRKVKAVIYWLEGDDDARQYSTMDAATETNPDRKDAILLAQRVWPAGTFKPGDRASMHEDAVLEQVHAVGVIRKAMGG